MHKSILNLLLIFLLLGAGTSFAYGVHEKNPYTFTITKRVHKFYEAYQINSPAKETYSGTVKNSWFRIRTNYDLSNSDGWQATGIIRIISFGTFYPWGKDIDIYDTRNVKIGLIDGNFATFESARYDIYEYDEAGNSILVGTAYASKDFDDFVIYVSNNDPRPIAELRRNVGDRLWTVTVHDPDKIDDRIIRIFAGFVIDYQDKFIQSEIEDSDYDH